MNYRQIPSITRRNGRYAGNTLVGCASLMMRLAVTGMGIAIVGLTIAVLLGGGQMNDQPSPNARPPALSLYC